MKNINEKRKELGIKINDLARKINIDSSLMSRILSGKRKPTKEQLLKIADILSIDSQEVLKVYLSEEIVEMLKSYPGIATSVLEVAEERIAYLSSPDKFQINKFSSQIESLLKELSRLNKIWSSKKPLNDLQLKKMNEYFHTAYTYESNRIEGNTLSLKETHLVINEGITIGGKSMIEHLEVMNHKEAIEFIYDLVDRKVKLNSYTLKQIHQLVLKNVDNRGAGVYRKVPVRIAGSEHIPPEPYMLDRLMEDYFIFYEIQKNKLHPVILAAEMHERLVSIHPFIDGNGRTSRLIMNLILIQNGYSIVNLKGDLTNRMRYYKALETVQLNHDTEDFHLLIIEHAKASIEEHIALAG
jgi:Fic family protein/plasmid maintenance system antidote protein VapI